MHGSKIKMKKEISVTATFFVNGFVAFGLVACGGGSSSTNTNNAENTSTTVSGRVYIDANINAAEDTGELGMSNTAVVLQNISNNTCRSVRTTISGDYSFAAVSNGAYKIYQAHNETIPVPQNCGISFVNNPTGYESTTDDILSATVASVDLTGQSFGETDGVTSPTVTNGTGTGTGGTDTGCVNIGLPSAGLKYTTEDYLGNVEVSTIDVFDGVSFSETGTYESTDGTIEPTYARFEFTITDDYINTTYSENVRGNYTSETNASPPTRSAVNRVCLNQTWTDSVNITGFDSDENGATPVNFSLTNINTIEAINEARTVRAGTFTTYRERVDNESTTTYWKDQETGVIVYMETDTGYSEELIDLEP